jgi:divinyl chlorophyllide a 8-vinyl-reductase
LFGDGTLTACKPISDDDLAQFILGCLNDPARHNSILPIGGPGPAITPRAQGDLLFTVLGKTPTFKHVPVGMMTAIIGGLTTLGAIIPSLRKKAELARIGRYYATESMLVWDAAENRYDADQTPEYGSDTLADHYQKLAQGTAKSDRGDHAVF